LAEPNSQLVFILVQRVTAVFCQSIVGAASGSLKVAEKAARDKDSRYVIFKHEDLFADTRVLNPYDGLGPFRRPRVGYSG
jgi:hypothetical protein